MEKVIEASLTLSEIVDICYFQGSSVALFGLTGDQSTLQWVSSC